MKILTREGTRSMDVPQPRVGFPDKIIQFAVNLFNCVKAHSFRHIDHLSYIFNYCNSVFLIWLSVS